MASAGNHLRRGSISLTLFAVPGAANDRLEDLPMQESLSVPW
jgi:hypothetical protein